MVIIAVGVNSDGRCEILGMDIGPAKAETFWMAFLRNLACFERLTARSSGGPRSSASSRTKCVFQPIEDAIVGLVGAILLEQNWNGPFGAPAT